MRSMKLCFRKINLISLWVQFEQRKPGGLDQLKTIALVWARGAAN